MKKETIKERPKYTFSIKSFIISFIFFFLLSIIINFLIHPDKLKPITESCVPRYCHTSVNTMENEVYIGSNPEGYKTCMQIRRVEAYQYSIMYNSSEDCLGAPKKQLCYTVLASKTKDVNDCNGDDYCTYLLAIGVNDENLCNNISTIQGQAYCNYQLALRKRDSALCEKINSSEVYGCHQDCVITFMDMKHSPAANSPTNLVICNTDCMRLYYYLNDREVFYFNDEIIA